MGLESCCFTAAPSPCRVFPRVLVAHTENARREIRVVLFKTFDCRAVARNSRKRRFATVVMLCTLVIAGRFRQLERSPYFVVAVVT